MLVVRECIDLWGNNSGYALDNSDFYHYNYDMNECDRANASDDRQYYSSIYTNDCSAYLNVSCSYVIMEMRSCIIVLLSPYQIDLLFLDFPK